MSGKKKSPLELLAQVMAQMAVERAQEKKAPNPWVGVDTPTDPSDIPVVTGPSTNF